MLSVYRLVFISVTICYFSFQTHAFWFFPLSYESQEEREEREGRWFTAARTGNIEIIRKLLDTVSVDVNVQDLEGNTALLIAIENGYENIVQILLATKDIDVNIQNSAGTFALLQAAFYARENIVKLLLAVPDININEQHKFSKITALMQASSFGYKDIVNLLLQTSGINVNLQSQNGCTALMYASSFGNTNIIKLLLLVPGIDINVKNKLGNTALMFGCDDDENENMIRLLLSVLAININGQNKEGYTALMISALSGCENIVKLLLAMPGININAQNKEGNTAFAIAIKQKHYPVARLIGHKMRELNVKAFQAIKHKNLKNLKSAIAQIGVDIVNDAEGNTLLDKACADDNQEMVEAILKHSNNPQELISRIPFEATKPNSALFQYFVDLAYCEPVNHAGDFSEAPSHSLESPKAMACAHCSQETIQFCGKCKKVYYCSEHCQKADWKTHKRNCKT